MWLHGEGGQTIVLNANSCTIPINIYTNVNAAHGSMYTNPQINHFYMYLFSIEADS